MKTISIVLILNKGSNSLQAKSTLDARGKKTCRLFVSAIGKYLNKENEKAHLKLDKADWLQYMSPVFPGLAHLKALKEAISLFADSCHL